MMCARGCNGNAIIQSGGKGEDIAVDRGISWRTSVVYKLDERSMWQLVWSEKENLSTLE